MKKRLFLWAILILITAVFAGGCAGLSPESTDSENSVWFSDSMRWLTDIEKDKAISIALNTPEALKQREIESIYKTELDWIAIVFEASEPTTWWALEYETVETGIPAYVPQSAEIYPRVLICFGDPENWYVMVAVDLEAEEAVLVEEYPARGSIDLPEGDQ